jgi:hypothetical protein
VATAFADSWVGRDRLEPFGVGQTARGQFRGEDEGVEIAEWASRDERCGPSPVRETRVELLLGKRSWQGVELGYAADDETLTFQLDG